MNSAACARLGAALPRAALRARDDGAAPDDPHCIRNTHGTRAGLRSVRRPDRATPDSFIRAVDRHRPRGARGRRSPAQRHSHARARTRSRAARLARAVRGSPIASVLDHLTDKRRSSRGRASLGVARSTDYRVARISRMSLAASDGVLPTFTPAASRASFLA